MYLVVVVKVTAPCELARTPVRAASGFPSHPPGTSPSLEPRPSYFRSSRCSFPWVTPAVAREGQPATHAASKALAVLRLAQAMGALHTMRAMRSHLQ